MLTTRKISKELIEATIKSVKITLKDYSNAAGSSAITAFIKRRKSLTNINQDFMNYDADLVGSGSVKAKLIAGAVPTSVNFPDFCADMVYNQRYPIKSVITFGELAYPSNETPNPEPYVLGFDSYNAFIKYDADSAMSDLIRTAVLTVTQGEQSREVEVTIIDPDNFLKITPEQLPIVRKLYEDALLQNTLVFGELAGQLILMFEILRNFKELFHSDNPQQNAEAIKKLLSDISKDRKGLVPSIECIEFAISSAYAMTQGLLAAKIESPTPPALKAVRSSSEGSNAQTDGKFGFASASSVATHAGELDTSQQRQHTIKYH